MAGVGPRAVSMHLMALSPGAIAGLGRHKISSFIWVYSTQRFSRH